MYIERHAPETHLLMSENLDSICKPHSELFFATLIKITQRKNGEIDEILDFIGQVKIDAKLNSTREENPLRVARKVGP